MFPPFVEGVTSPSMRIDASPERHSSKPLLFGSLPFRASRTDRLFLVEMNATIENTRHECVFVIPSWTLISELDRLSKSGDQRDMIPWDEWGPHCTRMLQLDLDSQVDHDFRSFTMFGTRCITVENGFATFYDFNRFAIRRAMHSTSESSTVDHGTGLLGGLVGRMRISV